MNLFKELKRYVWVILFIMIIGLNSYNISKNTNHCNSNAVATIQLAGGIDLLADTFTDFIKNYVKNRNRDLLGQEANFNLAKANWYLVNKNITTIMDNKTDIMVNQMEHYVLTKEVENLHKKPTYEYLKSVTVFVRGRTQKVRVEVGNRKRLFVNTSSWCGTGVIVKIDKDYTYILTNRHVAGGFDSTQSNIFIIDGKNEIKCEIIKIHATQDLALMKIETHIKGKQVVKGLAFPTITEKVYTVGHSLCRPFMYGEGVFSGTIIEHDVYQLPCIGGQSGSGVFNKHGELLGLVYSISGSGMGYLIAWDVTRSNVVKGIYVKEFLEANL